MTQYLCTDPQKPVKLKMECYPHLQKLQESRKKFLKKLKVPAVFRIIQSIGNPKCSLELPDVSWSHWMHTQEQYKTIRVKKQTQLPQKFDDKER